MSPSGPTRREFVAASSQLLGGAWLAAALPLLASLSACARDAARRGEPLVALTADEGSTLTALAGRILPADDLPGAVDAGAVHFVDRALESYFPGMRDLVRGGLADLDLRARGAGAAGFAALPPERQDALIREVEETPFFGATRMLVVAGTFCDPSHGGNREGAGWAVLGVEHRGSYQPPFGYYDAEHAREEAERRGLT